MSQFCIYHNPRCSKSRSTLAILEEKGVDPQVILYLETKPDASEIRSLLKKLGVAASEIIRRGEDEYASSGLSADSKDDELIDAMAQYPRLIERPIVVCGDRAVVGRPPENVLELFN